MGWIVMTGLLNSTQRKQCVEKRPSLEKTVAETCIEQLRGRCPRDLGAIPGRKRKRGRRSQLWRIGQTSSSASKIREWRDINVREVFKLSD